MGSIVLDLERDALDRDCPVSDLLRRALVVAGKLDLPDFQSWITNELSGYRGSADEVPAYRKLRGEIKAHNAVRGWIPVSVGDEETSELISGRVFCQPVAELEHLVLGAKSRNAVVSMSFPPDIEQMIMSAMQPMALRPVLHLSVSSVVGILDAVRNTVLNWALRLEKDGVMGENLSFSREEKARASDTASHVNNFYAPVSGSMFAAGARDPVQIVVSPAVDIEDVKALIAKIRAGIVDLDLNADASGEVMSDLATVESQARSPKPKAGIIRQSLASIRSVLEGAGGNVLGALIADFLTKRMTGG